MATKLLDGVTTDTTGTVVAEVTFPASASFHVYSTNFGGGTVTIQGAPPDPTTGENSGNYASLGTDLEFTASGWGNAFPRGKMFVRAVLAGSTSPSAVTVTIL